MVTCTTGTGLTARADGAGLHRALQWDSSWDHLEVTGGLEHGPVGDWHVDCSTSDCSYVGLSCSVLETLVSKQVAKYVPPVSFCRRSCVSQPCFMVYTMSVPFTNILIGMFCVALSDMCILMEHCVFPAATMDVQAPGDAPVWRQLLRLHQGHRDPGALVTNFAHGAGLDFVVLHQW